jgi:charged multivesicular body protein 4A/B
MSFFKSLFSKEKKPTVPPGAQLTSAIQKNKEAIGLLEKRQQLIEKKISDHVEDARQRVANGDKRGALLVLKRKKLLEQELETLMNSHITLEQQILSMESAQTSQLAVQALQSGIAAQKTLNKEINIDQVDQLMEDMQEQQELQSEIAGVLSQGARLTDDADLLSELDGLQADDLQQKLTGMPNVPVQKAAAKQNPSVAAAMPAAPVLQESPPVSDLTADEERELRELQALQN